MGVSDCGRDPGEGRGGVDVFASIAQASEEQELDQDRTREGGDLLAQGRSHDGKAASQRLRTCRVLQTGGSDA